MLGPGCRTSRGDVLLVSPTADREGGKEKESRGREGERVKGEGRRKSQGGGKEKESRGREGERVKGEGRRKSQERRNSI
ncbi:hypothetical protein Pmani_036404 [Petrolisthes manimaculis]|uniref:Uncharacterized protein n=1 Tax=Petrolisthes manimaculis TaxID=1843537 RepID=A0AAE1NIJ0_9EUCA|nr:hypothetical protein Pmani_036404 [Petrolisthes manimaculis]